MGIQWLWRTWIRRKRQSKYSNTPPLSKWIMDTNICRRTLVFRNYTLYEFSYFLGIGAAIQSLLTPDAGMYGFPHFRYIQPMISHGLLVSIGVYMTVVESLRPTWKSLARVFVITNLYMFVIYFVNLAIGSNYMMVNAKPNVTSLFDLLPAWPWYIPCADALALVILLLLYLPFAVKDWRAKAMSV